MKKSKTTQTGKKEKCKYRGWNWSNQGLNWKKWKFGGQLRVKIHKFITNDQNEKWVQFKGWQLSLAKVKFHEIKNLKAIIDEIKINWKNWGSIEIVQFQIKRIPNQKI